ncbi:GMC oxidoreductase [Sagittula sp. S175]|uniref:GMC oxidoreductase n=1 Tax=Sagittula sp. S175 TaxID=3415129 RepID=UPI003C7BCC02
MVATTNGAYGHYGQDKGLKMLMAGAQYLLFKSGPVTTTGVETCAFLDPRGDNARPTIQMFCVPTVCLDRDVMGADPGHGTRGLRLIDASLMPNIVSGNTNAAVMAAASRAVQRILASGAPA